MDAAIRIAELIESSGRTLKDASILEIGTGRRINMPLTWWLMGASSITTVDLNPYLKRELILEDIVYMQDHITQLKAMFGHGLDNERLDSLVNLVSSTPTLDKILHHCCISYLAPADAARLPIHDDIIDYHLSYTVLEHIPPKILSAIMIEGCRVARPDALFVHCFDHSDHFSHSDPSISSVNFLQYGDREWQRIAGNRYMYMNRLRIDDYEALIENAGLRIIEREHLINDRALALLESASLHVDTRFTRKSNAVLATQTSCGSGNTEVTY